MDVEKVTSAQIAQSSSKWTDKEAFMNAWYQSNANTEKPHREVKTYEFIVPDNLGERISGALRRLFHIRRKPVY